MQPPMVPHRLGCIWGPMNLVFLDLEGGAGETGDVLWPVSDQVVKKTWVLLLIPREEIREVDCWDEYLSASESAKVALALPRS